jgi:branched-chain amino acid transport system ATP-binding protein
MDPQQSKPRLRRRTLVAAGNGHSDYGDVEDVLAETERPRDETAGAVHLPVEPSIVGLAVGDPAMMAGVEQRRGLRDVLRDARDFRELRATKYGILPLVVLAAITFFQSFDSAAFDLGGPTIARKLNISVGDVISIQVLVGSFAIIASLFAGWYADRHKRVPFVGIGTLISGLAAMATSTGKSFAGIATPRVIDDTSYRGGNVPTYSLLADYYPPTVRGKAFALLGNLEEASTLFVPIIAGFVIVEYGFATAFFVFGIPLAVMGIVALITLKEPVRGYWERKAMGADEADANVEDEAQSFGEAWRATLSIRTIRRILLADVFRAGASLIGLFLPFYYAEKYGLSALDLAYVFLPTAFCSLIGGFIGGGLIDTFMRRNPSRVLIVLGVAGLIGAPRPLLFIAQPPIVVLVAISCLFSFGLGLVGPASNVVYSQVLPANIRTQGLQLFGLASFPTRLLFLPIARYFFSQYSYDGVWVFSIPFAIVGAFLFMSASSFFELDMRNAFASTMAQAEWKRAKDSGSKKLLVARNVDVGYSGVQVLFDIDLDIEEGEIVALLGTNGAGKSTVLRAICGITEASAGGIIFNGKEITHMPPHEVAARGIIQMPGGRGIFPGMSVRENLLLGTWLCDDPAENEARLREVFEIFPGLRERPDALAGDLSGGQQQQLSLAQAFLSRPQLLLIDELSLGLSPIVVGELVEVVKEINRRGVTVIVVEQSVNVALTIADRAIFMEKGEIKFDGPTADLLARPDILRAVYVKGTGSLTDGAPAGARRSERDRRSLELEDSRFVLEVDSLVKHFGGVTAVNGVSFGLREGEVLGLIGPNGAGKTTIFDLISGQQKPDDGIVYYDGVDITGLSPEQRAQRKLIRRFQDARLFPSLTVFETLLVSLEQRLEVRNALLNAVQAPSARRAERRVRARAEKLIELLDLGAYRDKFVRELSTGLRRIVDLACVLAAEPKVLLLDEPSSGIAQAEAEGLGPLLQRVRFETGCSILIIEHDMPLISAVSDELIAFDQGTFVVRGTPDEVLNDERVIESYLGTTEAAVNRSGSTT